MDPVLKPQGHWMEDAKIGVLTEWEKKGRLVLVILDHTRQFMCVDVRQAQSFPTLGQTVSLALGHHSVGEGVQSLDWIWSGDVSKTLRRERDAPAG